MKIMTTALLGLAALGLSACGGDGDDALAENAQENLENQGDAADAMAGNMADGPQQDAMEEKGDMLREKGERVEEAVDNTDVDTDDLTRTQQNALVNQVSNEVGNTM